MSGHLDKNSKWTPIWVEPLPLLGCKNWEFQPPKAEAWLDHGLSLEPCQTSTHRMSAATVAAWLEIDACLSTCRYVSDWDFVPDACSARFYCVSSPSVCVSPVCDIIGSLGRSLLINLAPWKYTHMCKWLPSGCYLAHNNNVNNKYLF